MSKSFEKGDLFAGNIEFEVSESTTENITIHTSGADTALCCPRCGKPGSGPHKRWVTNGISEKHYFAYYFSHGQEKNRHWCYLTKTLRERLLDNCQSKQSSSVISSGGQTL